MRSISQCSILCSSCCSVAGGTHTCVVRLDANGCGGDPPMSALRASAGPCWGCGRWLSIAGNAHDPGAHASTNALAYKGCLLADGSRSLLVLGGCIAQAALELCPGATPFVLAHVQLLIAAGRSPDALTAAHAAVAATPHDAGAAALLALTHAVVPPGACAGAGRGDSDGGAAPHMQRHRRRQRRSSESSSGYSSESWQRGERRGAEAAAQQEQHAYVDACLRAVQLDPLGASGPLHGE